MSGIELQDRLIAAGHKGSHHFHDGLPRRADKARAIKAGAFGFLTKPFAQNTLMDCVPPAARKLKASGNLPDAPSSKLLIKINTAPRQSFALSPACRRICRDPTGSAVSPWAA
jgi:FixJ family two-component response regulator